MKDVQSAAAGPSVYDSPFLRRRGRSIEMNEHEFTLIELLVLIPDNARRQMFANINSR